MLKTIFLGSSEFVLPTLEILKDYSNLSLIITGLDKTVTKRQKESYIPEPKTFAIKHQIPFLQPISLKDMSFLDSIKAIKPDLGIVVSYGKLLPQELFEIPSYGIFNLHGSILPFYRGASPIQESLLQGDIETGITIQKINERFDEGDVLGIIKTPIEPDEVYPQLRKKLSLKAAQLLKTVLEYYYKHQTFPKAIKQEGTPSFCTKIKKEHGIINPMQQTAQHIYNQFRAYYTWPQIQINIKGILCKLLDISIVQTNEGSPGKILQANKEAFIIKTQKDAISIKEIQPQNKKRVDFISYINGYSIKKGDIIS